MKKYLAWSFLGGALAGCLPLPRFVHVYSTPQYMGVFVDRQRRPVANVLVSFLNDPRQLVQTGPDGRAVLSARRRFQVVRFVVMDPARPHTAVRASWGDTTSGVRRMFQHLHEVSFLPDQQQPTTVQDTVELPLSR